MADWPSISQPSLPVVVELDDPAMRSQQEGGYELTRPRFTRIRRRFSLTWPAMTKAHHDTLMTFYTGTAIGGSMMFNWTSPADGVSRAVRFAGAPRAEVVAWATDQTPKYYAVSLTLAEV